HDKPRRFEASVGPMPGGKVLWRLRELGVGEHGAEEARKLFLDDAPIGFFAARADGAIVYMNRALRAVLGVGDDPSELRVRDIVKEEAGRALKRERRGFGVSRTRLTLKARDGMEQSAAAIAFWPNDETDDTVRTLVFFSDVEAPEEATTLRATADVDGVF